MPYLYLYDDGVALQSQDPPSEDDEVYMSRGNLRCFALVGAEFTEIKSCGYDPVWFPGGLVWEDIPER